VTPEVEAISAELLDELAEAPRSADPRFVPVRFSNLKRMKDSPAHYRHACQFSDDSESLARKMGTVTHALCFGTPEVVVYTKRRQGKAWDQFNAEHTAAGMVIASPREYAASKAMADALRSHPIAAPLMFDGGCSYEQQVSWRMNDLSCTGRIDVIHPAAVVDLKTARTARPESFLRSAEWMGYHAQVVWYMDGLAAAGSDLLAPYIIAVESGAPNPVVVFKLTEQAVDMGRRLYRLWLEQLAGCIESNQWPGYAQSVVDFDVAPVDEEPFVLIGEDGEDIEL
jgi:hypothetical protein